MSEAALKSRVIKTEPINWQNLEFIQQENFKEWVPSGDLKLQASLIKYQFIDPFKVWQDGEKLYCLDGRHRFLDLTHLKDSGVEVPDQLPATFLDCENITEAAELVLVYSSQYAKITNQGLFEFVSKFKIDLPELNQTINIPEFSMERFEQKFDLMDVENAEEEHVYFDDEDNIIVRDGDVFQINEHRIVCASFKDKEKVSELMQDDKARV